MGNDRWCANTRPYTPKEVKGKGSGLRPSVAHLIEMLDTDDPAFGKISGILTSMVTAGVEVDEAAIAIAIKLGRQQMRMDEQASAVVAAREVVATPLRLWPEEQGRASIVYYIRRGMLIKIGTTTNPHKRFKDLVPDEVLAWEPGGKYEELRRHRQFTHLRQGQGEYFKIGPDLVGHCKAIRKLHGDPDPTWRTSDNVSGSNLVPLPSALPLPASPVTVNGSEAAEMLGISRNTIASWVHRKQLNPVGVDEKNRPIYFLEHVRYLKDRSRVRRDSA